MRCRSNASDRLIRDSAVARVQAMTFARDALREKPMPRHDGASTQVDVADAGAGLMQQAGHGSRGFPVARCVGGWMTWRTAGCVKREPLTWRVALVTRWQGG